MGLSTGLSHVMAAGFPQGDESMKRKKGERRRVEVRQGRKRKKKRKEGGRGQKYLRQKTQSFMVFYYLITKVTYHL